jgi:carboxylesterase type B
MFCPLANHIEWWWAAEELMSDTGIRCGSRYGAQWLSGSQPVYLYSFEHAGNNDEAGHCSENEYFMQGPPYPPGSPTPRVEQAVGAYLHSFAKHGNPNTDRMAGTPEWPAYTCVRARPCPDLTS